MDALRTVLLELTLIMEVVIVMDYMYGWISRECRNSVIS